MTNELPKQLDWLIQADQALQEACTLEDFKSIRDRAKEAQTICKIRDLPLSVRIDAAEIRAIAARRAGQVIAEMHKSHGGRPAKSSRNAKGKNRSPVETSLKNLGISKNDSHRWQRFTNIPDDDFSRYLKECREAGCEVTREGLLRLEKWLRVGGSASGLPRPRGGERARLAARPRPSGQDLNPNTGKGLRPGAYEPLDLITIHGHRQQLQEFLSKLLSGKPLVAQDAVRLEYVRRLCGELIKHLEH